MFAQQKPVETVEPLIMLDPRWIEQREINEILEHVLLQVREAQVASGYSRMHHRHSRTSG